MTTASGDTATKGLPMTTTHVQPVPFDPEVAAGLAEVDLSLHLTRETLAASRAFPTADDIPAAVGDRPVSWTHREIPGPADAPALPTTIYRPAHSEATALPILYDIHGGGMVVGNRFQEAERMARLVDELQVVAVTIDYRLAPEHPFPAGVEDCYAGLEWIFTHAAEFGGDPDRIIVMGGSAGGGFAAAISLMARDRQGPEIAGQLLLCPMIDNTNTSVSSHQYDGLGVWQREANLFAWECVLGEQAATSPDAPAYAAPSRASDMSGLPPAFIEVGSAETFRDEDVEYASRIWATGGEAELHVWSGGCHGFDVFMPNSRLSAAAHAARVSWLRRVLEA